jgi:hypothetical protein
MIKEIKYTGYSATPTDYECPDGQLSTSVGLVPDNGSLTPVQDPVPLFRLSGGARVVFIHQTANYRHYIIKAPVGQSQQFLWSNTGSDTHPAFYTTDGTITIHQVNAIGNTLVILTSQGIQYFLWKNDTDGYLHLGNHMPELPITFSLLSATQYYSNGNSPFYLSTYSYETGRHDGIDTTPAIYFKESTELDNQVLGAANQIIASARQDGKFIFPFLVRYAYRLYDGSITMHSAPVLMTCSSAAVPILAITASSNMPSFVSLRSFDLQYIITQAAYDTIKQWGDIISSIDIFISRPIQSYDPSGHFTNAIRLNNSDSLYQPDEYLRLKNSYFVAGKRTGDSNDKTYHYQKHQYIDTDLIRADTFLGILPTREQKDFLQEVADCHTFYLLHSIAINDLKTERTIIPVQRDYLTVLEQKEVMTDDYNSHDILLPRTSFTYNSRLNLANLQKILFPGFSPASCLQFSDYSSTSEAVEYRISYLIRQDNKELVVSGTESVSFNRNVPFTYLFYPNVNAYKAIVEVIAYPYTTGVKRTIPLSPHPTLNGAYFFRDFDFDIFQADTKEPPESSDQTVNILNKIYTSEVNNPFHFPVTGINTIGTGTILGISTAAKALSQGQFGQFPLYAFTTEGVWALEVSSTTGGFSARQPITRDVCINADSITQLDSSVLFATDRGIMLLSGSKSECISDSLLSAQTSSFESLPQLSTIATLAGISTDSLRYLPFHDYIKQCRIIYSYTLQRIILFNPTQSYAYIYSLKDKQWGMAPSTIASAVPSYPEALAMLTDGTLADFSTVPEASADGTPLTGINGLVVTRPLKLDAPNLLKTVDTVIQRGQFQRGHVKTVLFGSRDLIHWFYITSSVDHYMRGFRGTSYKYFRIAIICHLLPSEYVQGCTIQFTPRFLDRVR